MLGNRKFGLISAVTQVGALKFPWHQVREVARNLADYHRASATTAGDDVNVGH